MATLEELYTALENADAAGDTEAAQEFALMIQEQETPEMTWGDVASEAVSNIPSSAAQFAEDIVTPLTQPVDTAKAFGNLALGVGQKLIPGEQEEEKYADAVGQFFKDRYGTVEGFKRTVAEDPVGVLSDISMLFTGGGMAAAKAPGMVGKAGRAAMQVGEKIDPVVAMVKGAARAPKAVAGGVADVIGNIGTHTGGESIKQAAKAGFEGGERAAAFRAGLEGTADLRSVVDDAKAAVGQLKRERNTAYRAEMDKLGKQPDVLSFDKIDDAAIKAFDIDMYKGENINPSTIEIQRKISEELERWRNLPADEFHTAEGLDKLKQLIGNIPVNRAENPKAAIAIDNVKRAIKDVINEQDPTYAKIMKDYQKTSVVLDDLERELSLGNKAAASTSYRKLASALRNNVATNYGERAKMVELLESKGADKVMPTLAGASLDTLTPRGLGGVSSVGTGALGLTLNPALLAALPFQSPRLMGEAAYMAGKASRLPAKVGGAFTRAASPVYQAAAPYSKYARPLGYGSFQLGRMQNTPYLLDPEGQ